MDGLDLRKLLTYLGFGALVLAGGLLGLLRSGGEAASGDVVLVQPASEAARGATAGPEQAGPEQAGPAGAGGQAGGVASPARPAGPASSPDSPSAETHIYVQVAGAVRRPGVIRMPPGRRVFEALREAGGVTEEGDEQVLALAAPLEDGMRVYVPRKGESPPESASGAGPLPGGGGGHAAGAPAGGQKVSLSAASEAELQTLPGIGPAMAARIVAFREEHGPFVSVDELDDVPGVGPATMERLRPLIVP